MNYYLTGAISHNPNAEEDFSKAEEFLSKHATVFNPFRHCKELGLTDWDECMKEVLPKIFESQVLVEVTNPFIASVGRDIELTIGRETGRTCVSFSNLRAKLGG